MLSGQSFPRNDNAPRVLQKFQKRQGVSSSVTDPRQFISPSKTFPSYFPPRSAEKYLVISRKALRKETLCLCNKFLLRVNLACKSFICPYSSVPVPLLRKRNTEDPSNIECPSIDPRFGCMPISLIVYRPFLTSKSPATNIIVMTSQAFENLVRTIKRSHSFRSVTVAILMLVFII